MRLGPDPEETPDGKVIGETVASRFKAKLGDKDLSGGVFAGTVKPTVRETAPAPK